MLISFFDFITGLWSDIGEQKRNKAISVCVFLIPILYLIHFPFLETPWPSLRYANNATLWNVVGSIILIIIIILSAKKGFNPLKVNRVFSVFYFISALLILIPCFFHYVGEGWRPFALTMIFVFPTFYFTSIGTNRISSILRFFSWGLITNGYIIGLASIIIVPINWDSSIRYMGICVNPAAFALFLLPSIIGALYILTTSYKKMAKIVCVFLVCLLMLLVFVSETRSVLIAGILAILVALFMQIRQLIVYKKTIGKNTPKSSIIKALVAVAGIIVAILLVIYLTEIGQVILDRFSRFSIIGKTLDQALTGRWGVWAEAVGRLNFIGNDYRETPIIYNDTRFMGAHNIPLDVAYRCGIIAGIFYLLMILYALGFAFKQVFKNKTVRIETIFICMSIIAFFVVAMFEWELRPFSMLYNLCFFISLGPIMFKEKVCDEKSVE